jgi:acyl carrier protein
MSSPTTTAMSWEDFRHFLAQELMISEEKVVPEASLIRDLGVDSIRLVEMLLKMEEMGIQVPPGSAWKIQTVGAAYDFYRANATRG